MQKYGTHKQCCQRCLAKTVHKYGLIWMSEYFFTVTLDDSNSFQIQVYVSSDCENPPMCYDDCDKIDADYESSHWICQEYPGLCAFDFYQITELLIYHILGWNESAQQPRPEGGAFGVLDTWSHSIEEQGRKTLHRHYILWVWEWFPLLLGLRSNDLDIRDQSAKKLWKYIDTMLSTKLFAVSDSLIQDACDHECILDQHHIPIICDDQSICNLHYNICKKNPIIYRLFEL